jgi:hypothetical protein
MSRHRRKNGELRPSVRRAGIIARQTKALELRVSGHTFDEIAEAVGYSNRGVAYQAVCRALIETQRPAADELRTLLSARYDALLRAVWPVALDGDPKAVTAARQVVDSMVKLHIPMRVEATVTQQSETDVALRNLVDELERRASGNRIATTKES